MTVHFLFFIFCVIGCIHVICRLQLSCVVGVKWTNSWM